MQLKQVYHENHTIFFAQNPKKKPPDGYETKGGIRTSVRTKAED
jgi:hypothetical protein